MKLYMYLLKWQDVPIPLLKNISIVGPLYSVNRTQSMDRGYRDGRVLKLKVDFNGRTCNNIQSTTTKKNIEHAAYIHTCFFLVRGITAIYAHYFELFRFIVSVFYIFFWYCWIILHFMM